MERLPKQKVTIKEDDVKRQFKKVNQRSASGPDGVSGRTLKECCDTLAPVYTTLFQRSIDAGHVPTIWKTSTIVPIPKKPAPSELNDYRPVALTSVPFKCFERLVLVFVKVETATHQDSLQFAYAQNKSTDDAVATLLHHLCKHLDKLGTYVRVLFIDFSSAFNTIQPHLMMEKLVAMKVNPLLIRWVGSFLTGRFQQVRVGDFMSGLHRTDTGAPQGCVLSPALFVLYTADCRSCSNDTRLIKFADDSSLSAYLTDDETGYRSEVENLIKWCDNNYLVLNVSKTKELIFDFRQSEHTHLPIMMKGQAVEIVQNYKYLGTIINDKLDWAPNTEARFSIANQRMSCLRRLKKFRVSKNLLELFFKATIQSAMLFNQLCYYNDADVKDVDSLEALTRRASKIIGRDIQSPREIYNKAALKKMYRILKDDQHPLYGVLKDQESKRDSSKVMRSFTARTNRFRDSFVPTVIRLHNAKSERR